AREHFLRRPAAAMALAVLEQRCKLGLYLFVEPRAPGRPGLLALWVLLQRRGSQSSGQSEKVAEQPLKHSGTMPHASPSRIWPAHTSAHWSARETSRAPLEHAHLQRSPVAWLVFASQPA